MSLGCGVLYEFFKYLLFTLVCLINSFSYFSSLKLSFIKFFLGIIGVEFLISIREFLISILLSSIFEILSNFILFLSIMNFSRSLFEIDNVESLYSLKKSLIFWNYFIIKFESFESYSIDVFELGTANIMSCL